MDLQKLSSLGESLREITAKAVRPETSRSWYNIKNVATSTEVYIYDMIGDWGISASDFVNEIKDIKTSTIDLHINCEGGQVFDGITIYNALKNHKASVTVHIDGLAASAASFIAMAGDRVLMSKNSRVMIHDAHGVCAGNEDDFERMKAILADLSNNIASIYAERAGGTPESWRAAMKKETWYSTEQAIAAKLVDAEEPTNQATPIQVTGPVEPEVVDISWDFASLSNAIREAVA